MLKKSRMKGMILLVALLLQTLMGQGEQMSWTRGSNTNNGRKLPGKTQSPSPAPTKVPSTAPSTAPSAAPSFSPTKQMGSMNTPRPPTPAPINLPAPAPINLPAPTPAPINLPTPKPINSPTPKPTNWPSGYLQASSPTLPPQITWPTPKPTNWPSGYLQPPPTPAPATVAPATVAPTAVAATSPPTPDPTVSPTTRAPITVTNAPVISTIAPTAAPSTQDPSISPTPVPTKSPVTPSAELTNTVSPNTLSPTSVSPNTVSPTAASPTTASPTTASPNSVSPATVSPTRVSPTNLSDTTGPTTKSPTTESPSTVSPTFTGISSVPLLEFNILLKSNENGVNVGQLDSALEAYLQKGMNFTNLESVALTQLEGQTAKSNTLTATSVRFSGEATFRVELPLVSELQAEQSVLLKALSGIQTAIDQNSALNGVSVSSVSFDRIDAAASLGGAEVASGESNVGALLGIFVSLSVAAIGGALLIVRRRRLVQKRVPVQEELTPATKDALETFVDDKPGCMSLVPDEISSSTYLLTSSPKSYAMTTTSPNSSEEKSTVSDEMSLGERDLSAYMMTASPKAYALMTTSPIPTSPMPDSPIPNSPIPNSPIPNSPITMSPMTMSPKSPEET